MVQKFYCPRASVILLRLLAMLATLCATVIMATSRETVVIYSVTMHANFQYLPALKFFVIVNAIGAVYSPIVLLLHRTSAISHLVVIFDVVVEMVLVAAVAAAVAIAQVAKQGNSKAGWMPLCGEIPTFCNHAIWAIIAAVCGVVLYVIILVHVFHALLTPLIS